MLTEIEQRIRQRYGSLQEPDFRFVDQVVARRPYDNLLARLDGQLAAEDITDLNDDVCMAYVLRRDQRDWLLQLSLVGPYAVLLRSTAGGAIEAVSADAQDTDRSERHVLDTLDEAGVQLVDRETLSQPIGLRLFNTDPDDVRLYHALFSDSGVLPWEAVLTEDRAPAQADPDEA